MIVLPASTSARGTDVVVRRATVRDAERISGFYATSYASHDGRSPSDNYAFPQIFLPLWVESVIEARMVTWLVAEVRGVMIGAAGLLHGLGSFADGVAECFGLAVDPSLRGRGAGGELVQNLHRIALDEALVAIGEMRTVEPAVSRILARSGFTPVGFEPFVHHMIGGEESMLAVVILSPAALERRRSAGRTTAAVRRLAELVLSPIGAKPLRIDSSATIESRPDPLESARFLESVRFKEVDAEVGSNILYRLRGRNPAAPRFVDLRRMDELGREMSRRKDRYFIGIAGDDVVGCIHAAHNRHDYHLRIEAGAWSDAAVQATMLCALVELVAHESRGHACSVVAELTATDAAEQRALEAAGFVPTAYWPALVADGNHRADVVQYTRLVGYHIDDGIRTVAALGWPAAERIVQAIGAGFVRG